MVYGLITVILIHQMCLNRFVEHINYVWNALNLLRRVEVYATLHTHNLQKAVMSRFPNWNVKKQSDLTMADYGHTYNYFLWLTRLLL